MKNILLASLLLISALGAQAQIVTTLTINNHTACPVNAYLFLGSAGNCLTTCGSGGTPYVCGAYSVTVVKNTSMPCKGDWVLAAFNTSPNSMGYADGCEVGEIVPVPFPGTGCGPNYSGSFYVVSCDSFVNVTWSPGPGPSDVTIDIN
ncbi:MAG: hypothetical protein JST27_11420 [Bacteroidetes bacterium]|nr:hypothetical protein [Bacteroidota bacterium]